MALMLFVMPVVTGYGTGGGIDGGVFVEDFEPIVWQCGERAVLDEDIQPWRVSGSTCTSWTPTDFSCDGSLAYPADRDCWTDAGCTLGAGNCCEDNPTLKGCYNQSSICSNYDRENLIERNQQYLFEGERYEVEVVVFDKNKIEAVDTKLILTEELICEEECTYDESCAVACGVSCGTNQTCSDACVAGCTTCADVCEAFEGGEINCQEISVTDFDRCNARIDEEEISTFDPMTMQAFKCSIDILDSEHMYGILDMVVLAENTFTDMEGWYDEGARWFMNPIISLNVEGFIDFETIRPGTSSYSEPIVIENFAEGGVLLDMFITGKNWYSVGPELGRCWDGSNYVSYIPLDSFRYYTENGGFSTRDDLEHDGGTGKPAGVNVYDANVVRNVDSEGYVNIHKQLNDGFEENMFNEAEILQANPIVLPNSAIAYSANLLYPGSVGMSMIFRLDLPEPCYGEYEASSDGGFFIWAEAV